MGMVTSRYTRNTVQNTPLKSQELGKRGKATPLPTGSLLGKRDAQRELEEKNAGRKKARKDAQQKPQEKVMLLKNLIDDDDA